MTRFPLYIALGATILGAAPSLAPAAQRRSCSAGQPSALKGHNTDAPVDWTADRMDVDDKTDRAVLTGNVVATQGDMTLTAARVTECVARLVARHLPSDRTEPAEIKRPLRIAARRDRVIVFLEEQEVWACEAAERMTFVHSSRGALPIMRNEFWPPNRSHCTTVTAVLSLPLVASIRVS